MNKTGNYIQQLADYIKKNLNKGYTQDALRFSLINQGYSKISVEKAIELVNKQLADNVPPIKEKPQIVYKIIKNNGESYIPLSKKSGFWRRIFGE